MLTRALLLLWLLVPQSDPTVDAVVKEEKANSQVMAYLDHLTNQIGPRLTGSTRLTQACEWTRSEFEKMGLQARLVEWGTFPVGYDRGPWSARMTAPEQQDLTIGFAAWSPGTKGPVSGP
ncbi:MAG TPA: peptidase M28, partial [Planctomycetota bacterium]|nr:peptidase M28 [Planctomycetota bacterium]